MIVQNALKITCPNCQKEFDAGSAFNSHFEKKKLENEKILKESQIEANKLDIGENQITARFAGYELGFQMIMLDGDTEPSMTLSKYDYKNDRFLEHYQCDFETANID